MKITAIKATPVNIMLEAPYLWSQGLFPGFTHTIVEVLTDRDIVGIGQAPDAASAQIITSEFAPLLIGENPLDIQRCELLCLPGWRGTPHPLINSPAAIAAFGGLEMAFWDFRGKLWQQPLYTLLGCKYRDEVTFTDYFAFREKKNGIGGEKSPEAVAEYCLYLKETYGSTCFEGKVQSRNIRTSIDTVRLLRQVLGDEVMLRIDSNQAYSLPSALQMAPAMEELRVRNWEDPVGSLEEMVRLRRHTSIPFSSHNFDLPRALDLGAPDAFVTSVAAHGGIGRTLKFIAACEAMGRDVWFFSGDSGVGTAAYLHICAATQWIREPNQSLLRWQATDIIEGGPFKLRNNVVTVPEGPGLGVTLDSEAMAHCHELFLKTGPLHKCYKLDIRGGHSRLPLV